MNDPSGMTGEAASRDWVSRRRLRLRSRWHIVLGLLLVVFCPAPGTSGVNAQDLVHTAVRCSVAESGEPEIQVYQTLSSFQIPVATDPAAWAHANIICTADARDLYRKWKALIIQNEGT